MQHLFYTKTILAKKKQWYDVSSTWIWDKDYHTFRKGIHTFLKGITPITRINWMVVYEWKMCEEDFDSILKGILIVKLNQNFMVMFERDDKSGYFRF